MKTKNIMPREEYKDLGYSIGPFRCVSINNSDHTIACKRGDIWEAAPGVFKAYKLLKGKNEEKIFTFNINELGKWVLALEMPPNIQKQIYYANNPNERENNRE